MDQDDLIKKEQYYCNGSLNIQENGTILSEIKEEMDPMPVYEGQIKDDKDPLDNCDIDENQENSNTAETVKNTHLSSSKDIKSVHEGIKVSNCDIKPFKCKLCDYKAARNFNLKHHIESVHQGIKAFKCNICGIEFAQNSGLKKHIKSVHERIKPFKCNICDFESAQKAGLKRHIEFVHEGIKRAKPFKCNICNFQTSRNYYLKHHIESVHEGIKPFKCKSCGFKTAAKERLKKHIESVHERIRPFKCNICDFETATNSDLKKHTDSVHERIRPFKCNICSYKTSRNYYLKKHIESVHEGIKPFKPFKCNICGLETARNSDLKRHIDSVHEGIKSFKCHICQFESASKSYLKRHITSVHEDKKNEMSSITDKGMSKPKMSYARLISEALLNSPNGMLILSDIYKSISARHLYYQMNVPGWQNSIRHNLTLNKSFVKCTDGLKKAKDGKYSNYWKLSENLSKSVMKKLSKEELSKIQASLGISNAVVKKEKGKNCYVKSKTSFHPLCQNCNQTFVNKDQLNEHSCLAIKQESQEIMESVIEDSQNDQKVGFQSIKIEPLRIELTQTSDIEDQLLMHEIKKEHLEENEATPIQDLTEVYIKQEGFCENEQGNGMIVQEIKEEFVLGE